LSKLLTGQRRVEIISPPDGDLHQGWLHVPHGTSGAIAERVMKQKIVDWLRWREFGIPDRHYKLISKLAVGGPYPPLEPSKKLGYDLYVIEGRFRLEKPYEISLDTAIANRDRQTEFGVTPQEYQEVESDPWVASPDDTEYYDRLKKEAEIGTDNQDQDS